MTEELKKSLGGKGWIKFEALKGFMQNLDCKESLTLAKDNQHDGEYHRRWSFPDLSFFDLHANVYSAETFHPLVEWAMRRQL